MQQQNNLDLLSQNLFDGFTVSKEVNKITQGNTVDYFGSMNQGNTVDYFGNQNLFEHKKEENLESK